MLDVACSRARLAVARKKQTLGQPVARGMVGKYSIVLRHLLYPSSSQEVCDKGPFEILQNHQNFVWRQQQGVRHAVPHLAVEVGHAVPDPEHLSNEEQPLHAAVAYLGLRKGLVPGNVTREGRCQVSWGGRAYAPSQFWVMCWPDVLPILKDGLMLRELISTAARKIEQQESAAVSHGQAAEQVPSHVLQPSICSLNDDVMHIIMGHLVGKPWADIIRKIWDDKAATREETAGICVQAGLPAELCKVWWWAHRGSQLINPVYSCMSLDTARLGRLGR